MSTNLPGLLAVVNLVGDVAKDTSVSVNEPNQNFMIRVANYRNLLPDLVGLLSNVGDIPAEVKDLAPADYMTLVDSLVARLNIQNQHAEKIIETSLKLIGDLVETIFPDIQALLIAVRSAPTEAAPESNSPSFA